MTDEWPEILDNLARTGFFEEDQLEPETATWILAYLVRRFTTVIGYMTEEELAPIGSGTYVRRADGQHGILTAGHVMGAIKSRKTRKNIVLLPAQVGEGVSWVRIEGAGMHGYGEMNDTQKGPDIGWIPLSGEEAKKLEALGAVFYNRAKEREAFRGEIYQIGMVFGFVKELSSLAERVVAVHGMLIGRTEEHAPDEKGWDYGDYAITCDDPSIPRTHGGVSGSAAWRIDMPLDGSGRNAVTIEGVVFAEGSENDRKLIAHGENSIRLVLGGP